MAAADYVPLNLEIMRVPQNWIIVSLILLLVGISLGYIFHPANGAATQE